MENKTFNILFGIHDLEEGEMHLLTGELEKNGVPVGETACRYKKMGITQFLTEHPDYNVVILSEYLEEKAPYIEQDFEYLADMHESVTVIPILQNKSNGEGVVASLYSLGIFTGIFDADANFENIASVLLNGRTRKEAKAYYGIRELGLSHNSVDYRSTVSFLENADGKELEDMIDHVLNMVSDAEFATILKMLDKNTYEAVRALGRKDLIPYFMEETEEKEQDGKFGKMHGKIWQKMHGRKKAAALFFAFAVLMLGIAMLVRVKNSSERQEASYLTSPAATSPVIPKASPMPEPTGLPVPSPAEAMRRGNTGKKAKAKKPIKTKRPSKSGRDSKTKKQARTKKPNSTASPAVLQKPEANDKHKRKTANKEKSSERIMENDENIIGIK